METSDEGLHAHPQSTVKIGSHPLHPMLVPFPIAFWTAAFVTDIAFVTARWWMWAYISAWLLAAGIITALLAATAGFIDFLGDRRIRRLPVARLHLMGNVLALVLSIANFLVHTRGGAMAFMPTGLILSGIVALLLLFNGWLGGEMVFRHGVGVSPRQE